jgi:hypothetical protein
MGGNTSKSSIEQIINQKIINKSTLDVMNEQVTKMSTDSVMKNVSDSAAADSQTANIRIRSIKASGAGSTISNLNVGINQKSVVTLDVVDKTVQDNQINTELAIAIVNSVTQKIDNEQMQKLVSNAESDQKVAGLAFTGGNESDASVINKMNSETINETSRKFVSIVNNVITQSSQTLNYKSCIANSIKAAQIDIGSLEATNGAAINGVFITIDQTSQVMNKCILETIQNSKVTSNIASAIGLTILDETKNKQTSEGDATATAKQTIESIFSFGSIIFMIVLLVASAICAFIYMQMKGG